VIGGSAIKASGSLRRPPAFLGLEIYPVEKGVGVGEIGGADSCS
jgi:hypothetical protein